MKSSSETSVKDVEPGRGRPEVPTQMEGKTKTETETRNERETKNESENESPDGRSTTEKEARVAQTDDP